MGVVTEATQGRDPSGLEMFSYLHYFNVIILAVKS